MPENLLQRLLASVRQPRRTKVVGVGWAKTGTTTLGVCMQTLGYHHVTRRLDFFEEWSQGDVRRLKSAMQSYDSFDDWPWLLLFREFDREFPGTRFVLTTRPSGPWLKSYLNQIHQPGHFTPELNHIREKIYGVPFPGYRDELLVARYERHNAEVRDYFRGRDNFIELCWEKGDGWAELCGFLGTPVPDKPFPHANRGVYKG